jgi:hypothetical protein
MAYPYVVGTLDYDRWKCREFVHRVLRHIAEDQLPLFWYYLAFGRDEVLRLFEEVPLEVEALRVEWTQMMPLEQQDVLTHFVVIMEKVAKDAVLHTAALPRKEPEDDDPE